MDFVLTIPKGKNVLEFLQELDGDQALAKDAWHFLHRDVVMQLMVQANVGNLAPALALADGNCSFSLCYNKRNIGAINLRSMPCYDSDRRPIWFVISDIYLFEDSPICIAFRRPSPMPTEAIFLKLQELEE